MALAEKRKTEGTAPLTPKTEAWLADKVFGGKEWSRPERETYIDALKIALIARDASALDDVENPKARLMLASAYKYLTDGKPSRYGGKYSMTAEKIAEFWNVAMPKINAMLEKTQKEVPMEAVPVRTLQSEVNFEDKSEKSEPENKTYIRIKSGDGTYLIEFKNKEKIPEGMVLDVSDSVTVVAINYGGKNAQVMKLAQDGTVAATFAMNKLRDAQRLSKEKSGRVSVEIMEVPYDRSKPAEVSRLEFEVDGKSFYIETPKMTEKELELYKQRFNMLEPVKAFAALLERSGIKIYESAETELAKAIDGNDAIARIAGAKRISITHTTGESLFV